MIGTKCSMLGASTKAGGFIAATCKKIYDIDDGPGTEEEKAKAKRKAALELEGFLAALTHSPKDVFVAHTIMVEVGAFGEYPPPVPK